MLVEALTALFVFQGELAVAECLIVCRVVCFAFLQGRLWNIGRYLSLSEIAKISIEVLLSWSVCF